MGCLKELIQRNKTRSQVQANLRKNGFNRRKFKKEMKDYQNRTLDIQEILSREIHDNVVIDAYEYCMRKCSWELSNIDAGDIKDFLLCILFEGEVDNGGISQFFFNSSGDLYEETFAALKKIKPKEAEIFECALNCFPNGKPPKDRDRRIDLMEGENAEISEHLDEFDALIYNRENDQDYYDYLMEHKKVFLDY